MAGSGALAPYLIAAALYLMPQLETVYVVNPTTRKAVCGRLRVHSPQVEKLFASCGGCRAAIKASPT